MPTEEEKLDAKITEARAVISELNGMRKDFKTLMQQAKEQLHKSVEDHIRSVVAPALEDHQREMERMHTASVVALAKSNSNAWRAIGKAAFGDKPDPKAIGAILALITRAVHDAGKLGLLDIAPEDVVEAISAMIVGTVHNFESYNQKTFEHFRPGPYPNHGLDHGTPPHASVQDEPSQVG